MKINTFYKITLQIGNYAPIRTREKRRLLTEQERESKERRERIVVIVGVARILSCVCSFLRLGFKVKDRARAPGTTSYRVLEKLLIKKIIYFITRLINTL